MRAISERRRYVDHSTRKRRGEDWFRRDHAFSQAVLDSLPAKVVVLNREGVIVAVNQAWQQFAEENRAAPPTSIGVNYLEVARAPGGPFSAEASAAYRGIRAVLEGSVPHFSLEYPCHSPSKQRWFQMDVKLVRESEPPLAVVMHHEITAHKLAEEALRASDHRFRALVENGWDGISLLSANGEILFNTPAGTRMTGFLVGENCGKCYTEFVHPDDLNAVRAWFQAVVSGEDTHEAVAFRYRHKNGTWRWLEATAANLLADPTVQAIVVNYRDITETRNLMETLRGRLRQQQAVAELGLFAFKTDDLDALLHKSVETVGIVLDNEYCKVLELQPDGDSLLLRAGIGWHEGVVGHAIVPSGPGSQAGYTLLSDQPVIVADLRTETRFTGPQLLFDHGIVSGVSVVIPGAERPFGVLGTHTRQRRDFSQDDVNFLQSVANMLASFVERRRIETQYRQLVESIEDYAIVTLDPRGAVKTWNRGAERMTGFQAADVIGQSIAFFYPPEEVASGRPAQDLADALKKGKTEHEGWRLRHDGSRLLANCITIPLKDRAGKTYGFSSVVRDITATRREEESLRSVVNHSVDAIFTIDERGIIQSCGGAVQSIFGYSCSEVIGKSVNMLMPEPVRSQHDNYLMNYLRTGISKIIGTVREVVGVRKDSSLVPLELAVTEFRLDGRRFFTGILRDVSQRKKVEDELRRQTRAAQLSADRMSAIHETFVILASATSLKEATSRILESLCINLGWQVGEFWQVDKNSNRLRCTDIWSRSVVAEFEELSRHTTFAPVKKGASGLPGAERPRSIDIGTATPRQHRAEDLGRWFQSLA